MLILIQIKAIFLALFSLVFVLMPSCLLVIPFHLRTRLKIVGPVWSNLGHFLLRYACHAKIGHYEDLRSPEFGGTPCYGIYVANHQSFLDIPLLTLAYQAPPIMKKEILNIPIFGWMAWISGAIPVSRNSTASRRKVFERAKKRILVSDTNKEVRNLAEKNGIHAGQVHNDRYKGCYGMITPELRQDAGLKENETPLDSMSIRDLTLQSFINQMVIESDNPNLTFKLANNIRKGIEEATQKPLKPIWEKNKLKPHQAQKVVNNGQLELPL